MRMKVSVEVTRAKDISSDALSAVFDALRSSGMGRNIQSLENGNASLSSISSVFLFTAVGGSNTTCTK
jgi:hypothetical protein